MRYTDQLEVTLIDFGPKSRVDGIQLGPDEVIAIEGVGTFSIVDLARNAFELVAKGKDLRKFAAKVHFESTRRGHASLTTSFIPFLEVRWCSRALSMLALSTRFGSFLQESQRRSPVTEEKTLVPAEVRGTGLESEVVRGLRRAFAEYSRLVGEGVAIEDARYVLPLATATSFFSASSFESAVYLIRKAQQGIGIVTEELRAFASALMRGLESAAPLTVRSRLSFSGRWTEYALLDPMREPDGLLDRVSGGLVPQDAELLELRALKGVDEVLAERPDLAPHVQGLVEAVVLEAPSLAAYHQSIRHRTVPTAVESVLEASSRAIRDPQRNVVVPPDLRSSESRSSDFIDVCVEALELHERVKEEAGAAASVYLVPQSVRIRTVRVYDLFNLLSPMGFVATRTCSAAQWEERSIAYRVWREVERAAPRLGSLIGEKCKHLGYCPEREWCPIILKYFRYSDEEHALRNRPP
ncbi:MAG: FAD-dependent thymidylate synthase [Aigarchaeota archaeon]|nr:FAD-dependent thymidylate synthase [Aigarchaeota archaeon]MCS7127175.1 FAD-dependent thymidylate synthase [Candidatus Calditenuaceae archaeon]MDW8042630.1 FAD-dependent thymidylate synthase [Nitrososphaerota archaeon]